MEVIKMYKIYKYELPIQDRPTLLIENPARILSVKEQRGKIVVYALVKPESDFATIKKEIHFRVIGTGHDISEDEYKTLERGFIFLDTVKLALGRLMFHIFVEKKI